MAHQEVSHQAPVVTVFGSSRAQLNDGEYEAARRLGRLVAEHGWTLCNGGHDGTMEAAARGAKEAGGRTIGVTVALFRPAHPNPWLDEEIVAESLLVRLERLVALGDAYIVLRGGIGTLLEASLVWNLVQSPEFAHKPIMVVGRDWANVIDALSANLPLYPWERARLTHVQTVDEAVDRLASCLRQAPSP